MGESFPTDSYFSEGLKPPTSCTNDISRSINWMDSLILTSLLLSMGLSMFTNKDANHEPANQIENYDFSSNRSQGIPLDPGASWSGYHIPNIALHAN